MVSYRFALSMLFFALVQPACAGQLQGAPGPSDQRDGVTASGWVHIHGCVLDQFYIPKASAVRAMSADGRLLNRVLTDDFGIFLIAVPVDGAVTILIDKPDGDKLSIAVGPQSRSLGACLIE